MAPRLARLASIASVLALGAVGLALPDNLVAGGLAWLAFLFFVLAGWGWIVSRIFKVEDPDFGLRAAWGIAGYLAVAGVLVMLGVCSRPAVLALIGIGVVGFGWRELTTARPLSTLVSEGVAAIRARPMIAYLAILVGAAVLIQIAGAVAHLDRNPWDDDIAYTPMVKRLLDAGDLVEPFSFRRLASYGGQTVLQAAFGARGSIASVHALDHGLAYGLVLLLVLGHARTVRAPAFWLALVVLAVVLMPSISINTASYWSGTVCFLALYRTAVAGNFLVAALVAAGACTLRHTYIPVAALFLLFTLAFARPPRTTWLRTLGLAIAVAVPWCIAAFLSSRTFLFPFMQGTWNHGLTLGPSAWTWVDELSLFVVTAIASQPIVVGLVIVPLIAFTSDARPGRPLHALLLASVLGLALLVHSFTDADSETMWRYAFGYWLPLFCVFALDVASEREDSNVRLASFGRWVLIAALIVQLAASRSGHVKAFAEHLADVREAAHGDTSGEVERQRHAAMQATVPAGARMLVMLDDPGYLDFERNEIANLDVPGFASPGAQMPYFSGSEPVRAYLLEHGYRFVAFVRSERSRYALRRPFWVWRVFNDTEFFQAMSAYAINAIETFAQLATTSSVLYDADGLVVLDLQRAHEPARALDPRHERERRDAFTSDLARREKLEAEWSLTTRRGIVFADGVSGLTFAQANADAHWTDFSVVDPKPTRGTPIRWMYRRLHLRLRGDQDMHLVLRGRVNVTALATRPRLDVSLDGELLTSVTVDEAGAFTIDLTIDKAHITSWSDLYVVFNAIGQPERDRRELRVARLEGVTWEPR